MSVNKVTIRKADPSDFEIIYSFICELENTPFDKTILKNLYNRNIINENNIYIVAINEGQVAGYLSCHGQYLLHHGGLIGEIQEMFVRPEKRNMGLGKRLIQEVQNLAKEMGMLQLEVTVNNTRAQAHQFYLQEGFELTHKKFISILVS